jgi:hypothetical protein
MIRKTVRAFESLAWPIGFWASGRSNQPPSELSGRTPEHRAETVHLEWDIVGQMKKELAVFG